MVIVVRDALPKEFVKIARLLVEAYQEYAQALEPGGWDVMQANLSNMADWAAEVAEIIVAEEDGNLIGAVAYFAPRKSDSKIFPTEWASIRLLAVPPSHRGKGVGRRLTEECIKRARVDGATQIGLHTSELMTVARKMYERMGFRQDTELPKRLGLRYWRYVLALC